MNKWDEEMQRYIRKVSRRHRLESSRVDGEAPLEVGLYVSCKWHKRANITS